MGPGPRLDVARPVEVVDAVGPVAGDQRAAAGREGQAVEHRPQEAGDLRAVGGREVEALDERYKRLDHP